MAGLMWTLEQALEIVRDLEEGLIGWHVALAGGVLQKGHSDHDLDLVFFPRNTSNIQLVDLYRGLGAYGLTRTHTDADMISHWRSKGSSDFKHVEVWTTTDDKRVDVIILS